MNILLVCGGKYHDFEFARNELVKLLGESESLNVSVAEDYRAVEQLPRTDALITYTCDLIPDESQQFALERWLAGGGRWFALHGTNSIIEWKSVKPLRIATPDRAPDFMRMLGTQFLAHPPICDFRVEISDPGHRLVEGLDGFDTSDEIYLTRTVGDIRTLLHCNFSGRTEEFESSSWEESGDHPVMYLHAYGKGEVLYLTLGHCRGHTDMQPLMEHYPVVERCSWELPIYYELLRRGLRWCDQSSA